MSLSNLRQIQNRPDDARNLVRSSYARFKEGFETADLQVARQLLEKLD
jgi:predicted ATPase